MLIVLYCALQLTMSRASITSASCLLEAAWVTGATDTNKVMSVWLPNPYQINTPYAALPHMKTKQLARKALQVLALHKRLSAVMDIEDAGDEKGIYLVWLRWIGFLSHLGMCIMTQQIAATTLRPLHS